MAQACHQPSICHQPSKLPVGDYVIIRQHITPGQPPHLQASDNHNDKHIHELSTGIKARRLRMVSLFPFAGSAGSCHARSKTQGFNLVDICSGGAQGSLGLLGAHQGLRWVEQGCRNECMYACALDTAAGTREMQYKHTRHKNQGCVAQRCVVAILKGLHA